MSKKGEYLRALVTERLTAAAEEIFALFERTIVEYEEELFRSKEENQRKQQLLESVLSPQPELHKQDVPPQTLLPTCPDQGEAAPSQVTDSSQSDEAREEIQWAAIKMESDEQTDNSEDWEAPCSSSASHLEAKHEGQEEADQSSLLDSSGGEVAAQGHRHQCCFCDETFQRPQDLKKHMEIHALEIHLENLNRIKESGEALKQSCASYVATKANVPPTPVPPRIRSAPSHGPPFSCPFCKRCFARKFDLRSHILIHTGEKPFACSQCNMRFNRKSNLYRHFRNHAKKT